MSVSMTSHYQIALTNTVKVYLDPDSLQPPDDGCGEPESEGRQRRWTTRARNGVERTATITVNLGQQVGESLMLGSRAFQRWDGVIAFSKQIYDDGGGQADIWTAFWQPVGHAPLLQHSVDNFQLRWAKSCFKKCRHVSLSILPFARHHLGWLLQPSRGTDEESKSNRTRDLRTRRKAAPYMRPHLWLAALKLI